MMRHIPLGLSLVLTSCFSQQEHDARRPMFEAVSSEHSGILFSNILVDTVPLSPDADYLMQNLLWGVNDLMYSYAGGGVAVGDINNDGLPDIFFTSNQGSGALYLNLGGFRFKDITREAGLVYPAAWVTGAVMADVNGDGLMDIYVCRAGKKPMANTSNLLFINNGNLTFTEQAQEFGLDDRGLTTSASFFDMDNDGDLDVYVMNQPVFGEEDPTGFSFESLRPRDSLSTDRLYENVGGRFVDVTFQAGLPIEKGSGLGITVADLNMDGLPDIYVANDWITNDFLYINQGGGKFVDQCEELLAKNSFFSMGCDIADVDNNGLPDIFVCDMAPYSHYRRNMILNAAPQEYYHMQVKYKGLVQHSRNMLHLNHNGKFYESGNMHGIARTDWSWSPLIADFDNDGLKDLFVTNGMKRDLGNMDFEMLMYADFDSIRYKRDRDEMVRNYPSYVLPNRVFRNSGAERWAEVSEEWGLDCPLNTQGAAYADLDNDGNMDLILNPSDSVARVYRNRGSGYNHLSLRIHGTKGNRWGLGTKVWLYNDGEMQFSELTNARGFQSCSEPIVHFGVGKYETVDSVVVTYASGLTETLRYVNANQRLHMYEDSVAQKRAFRFPEIGGHLQWMNMTHNISPVFVHGSHSFFDFARDKTAYRMFSREGPGLAVGDLNGDGRDDFFIGGQAGQPSGIYFQTADGRFTRSEQPSVEADSTHADMHAIIIDLNADGMADIYVASGSSIFEQGDERYRDRIYLNNGEGQWVRCLDCLEDIRVSSGRVVAEDMDGDGIPELFVGGRVIPGAEGAKPESHLLKSINGHFKSTGNTIIGDLPLLGMVTDAVWYDLDEDGERELIVTCEWDAPKIFKKSGTSYLNVSERLLAMPNGHWTSVSICDPNGDGKPDMLFGNWGLNSILNASEEHPLTLLLNDFDGDGSTESVLCFFLQDTLDSYLGRNEVCSAMPHLWKRFNTYRRFAVTPLQEKFGKKVFDSSVVLETRELRSVLMLNKGIGGFTRVELPFSLQAAPINRACSLRGGNQVYLFGGSDGFHYNEGSIDALGAQILQAHPVTGELSVNRPGISGCDKCFRVVSDVHPIMVGQKEMMLIARPSEQLLLIAP